MYSLFSRTCYNILRAMIVVILCQFVWYVFSQGEDLPLVAQTTIFLVYFFIHTLTDILKFLNKDHEL